MACPWESSAAQRTRGEPAACEVARIPFPLCWLERGTNCYAVPCGHWCGLKRIAPWAQNVVREGERFQGAHLHGWEFCYFRRGNCG